jgi:hypothetical protein
MKGEHVRIWMETLVIQSWSGYAEMTPPKVFQGVQYVGLVPTAYKSTTIGYSTSAE